jgi:periplasmic protein TonB
MITKRNTNIAMNTYGLGYTYEQRYGMITSLSVHSLIFMLFFALSVVKSGNDVKTYYIQFTQMGEETVQAPHPARERKRPRAIEPERKVVREEIPVIKDTPVEAHEAVIRDNAIATPDVVKVASAPEPAPQPQAIHRQSAESTASKAAFASSGASVIIETEFGSTGAPAFVNRQIPVYPMMAKKLGKQGKVILRLHINEKGRLLNIEVVESAGYGFTESAMEAVKMSTFSPAHEKGASIASKALLSIRFVLKKV